MPVVAHVASSPRSLEPLLERAVRRASEGGRLSTTWVVAPTSRLLDHLERSLTRRIGALAGVRFLHHQALARHVLADAAQAPLVELDPGLLRALFVRRVRELDVGHGEYLRRQPSAFGALFSTFTDLRDAGYESDGATDQEISKAGRDTIALFRLFEELLRELAPAGFGDGAAVARAATAIASRERAACDRLLHYGAYELIGAHFDLVQALARSLPATAVEWFVPSPTPGAAAPAALLARAGATREPVDARPPPRSTVQSFASPREEIRFALRRLLAWHARDRVDFADMAVLARTSGPFAAALAAECAALGIAADTSFPSSLLHSAAGARLAPLLKALAEPSLPAWRRAERSWPGRDLAPVVATFEGGGSPRARLESLSDPIASLESEALSGWFDALVRETAQLEELVARAFADGPGLASWALERLEHTAAVDPRPLSALRVLDFHQARALPWRRAVIVGCNERLLPQRASHDFFLPDADRALLAERHGRPIPRRSSQRTDDELLFDVVRLAVDEELVLTHSRSDESGRASAPSPLLRRIEPPPAAAPLVRRHPFAELEHLLRDPGLLREEEALVLAAATRSEDARVLARRFEPLATSFEPGLAMVEAIDSVRSTGAALRFDGGGIAVRPKERFAVTELASLGRCPLQYFFAHELGLKDERLDEPQDGELSPRALGSLFHDVLRELYATILPQDQPPGEPAIEEARRRLPALLRKHFDAIEPRDRRELLPALIPLRLAQWEQELAEFVKRDLDRMRRLGLRAGAFEQKLELELDVAGRKVPLKLRLDRLLVDAAGAAHVGDYKLATSRKLRGDVSIAQAVRGETLQLPIYALALVAGRALAGLELLALRAPPEGEAEEDERSVPWKLDSLLARRGEIETALATLLDLRERGSFPLARDRQFDRGQCGHCDFRRACRHAHAATGLRVASASEHAAFFALAQKGRRGGESEGAT